MSSGRGPARRCARSAVTSCRTTSRHGGSSALPWRHPRSIPGLTAHRLTLRATARRAAYALAHDHGDPGPPRGGRADHRLLEDGHRRARRHLHRHLRQRHAGEAVHRGEADLRLLRRLIPAVIPGLALGALFLAVVDDTFLRRAIGVLLLVLAGLQLFLRWRSPDLTMVGDSHVAGLATRALKGAVGR